MHVRACAGTCFQTPTEGACQTLQTAECFDYRVDQIKAIPHIWYRFDEKPDGLKLKALAWIYSSYYRSLLSMTRFLEISGSDRCTGDRLLGGNEKVLTGGHHLYDISQGKTDGEGGGSLSRLLPTYDAQRGNDFFYVALPEVLLYVFIVLPLKILLYFNIKSIQHLNSKMSQIISNIILIVMSMYYCV